LGEEYGDEDYGDEIDEQNLLGGMNLDINLE